MTTGRKTWDSDDPEYVNLGPETMKTGRAERCQTCGSDLCTNGEVNWCNNSRCGKCGVMIGRHDAPPAASTGTPEPPHRYQHSGLFQGGCMCGKPLNDPVHAEPGSAEQFIESRLVPPLLHGDEKHQQWLREELRKWIPDLQKALNKCSK